MEAPKESIFKKPWVQSITGIISILIIASGILVYKYISSHVSIDDATVSAPIIAIGPESSGILQEVYVKTGDTVTEGQMLARVGAETLYAKVPGIVIDATNTPGQVFAPGSSVVKMIDTKEFRVIGTIKENEGLADIAVGDPVTFTVDAFGGTSYTGVIDSISATSRESGVVFNISDRREVKEFEVKIKYDISAYPEFKNGMSARIKIYNK